MTRGMFVNLPLLDHTMLFNAPIGISRRRQPPKIIFIVFFFDVRNSCACEDPNETQVNHGFIWILWKTHSPQIGTSLLHGACKKTWFTSYLVSIFRQKSPRRDSLELAWFQRDLICLVCTQRLGGVFVSMHMGNAVYVILNQRTSPK